MIGDGDMQMVRTHDPSTINLAIGEPFFLEEHLPFVHAAATGGPFYYPHPRGEPELLQELERRHQGMHVVVCNGAKQAISAALAAYAEVYGKRLAHHSSPYWPSYPFLVQREMVFNIGAPSPSAVRIVTSPNNPDGAESDDDCDIWDAAYASPVYGFTKAPAHWTVAIYSAAKMLGLSGLRVGWAVTADARLAQAMAGFVERFTSGVCVTSQRHVAYALRHLRIHDDHSFFDAARAALLLNGKHFNDILGFAVEEVHGVPNEGKGMFAWFRFKPEFVPFADIALQKSKVLTVSGPACGLDSRWIRMSMGHHEVATLKALRALSSALAEEMKANGH